MIILTIRTDKPEAEVGLFDGEKQVDYEVWQAHRQLAETLHLKIQALLERNQKTLRDIEGVVGYYGPGSFTGLRIGLSVVNALSASLQIPAIGTTGERWIQLGQERLREGWQERLVLPEYGAEVHITLPKH